MNKLFLAAICALAGVISALHAAEPENTFTSLKETTGTGSPKIQFETNFLELGKITAVDTVSGVFKFKNVGSALLKVSPPMPGCDCTESKVKPDILKPGETGEITYTIKFEKPMHDERKYIRVRSNDPQNPNIELTMLMDYTPLYEHSPFVLTMMLPAGKEEVKGHFTVTRTDGKPLQIDRFTTSQDSISAAFDAASDPKENSAQVNVTLHRPPGPPSLINGSIQMWNNQRPDRPLQTLSVAGEVQGELIAIPPRFYWVIPDLGKSKTNYPAATLTKTVELKSLLGHSVEIKRATSDIKGMVVKIIPQETGKKFQMILTFDEVPETFSNGKVILETSLASIPRLEVPVTISVPSDK
jgi:hypothetical protein